MTLGGREAIVEGKNILRKWVARVILQLMNTGLTKLTNKLRGSGLTKNPAIILWWIRHKVKLVCIYVLSTLLTFGCSWIRLYGGNATVIEFTLQTRALLICREGDMEKGGRRGKNKNNNHHHHHRTHHYKSQFSAFLNKVQSCKHVFVSIRLFVHFFLLYRKWKVMCANCLIQPDLRLSRYKNDKLKEEKILNMHENKDENMISYFFIIKWTCGREKETKQNVFWSF